MRIQCVAIGLLAQGESLVYTEAVLLIDNDEAELSVDYFVLKKGMGPYQ